MSEPYVGRPLKRVEDPTFVRGAGAYVDDLREPGLLHAAFVRSPHPHARIASIDAREAASVAGVVGVFILADLGSAQTAPAAGPVPNVAGHVAELLAIDRVRFVGDAVAVVLAESRYAAEDGARAVLVEYQPLPAIASATEALRDGAPLVHDDVPGNLCFRKRTRNGDVEGAFASAKHVVRVRSEHHRIAPVSLEPRGLLARPEPGGRLTVWASTQAQHRLRDSLATTLGVAPDRIRVIAPDVGGGFGAKGGIYREDVVVCALALKLGRPVKWVATRMEDLLTMQHARDQVDEAEAAFTASGRCTALRVRSVGNIGAYLHGGNSISFVRILLYPTGAYTIPALDSEVSVAFTNTNPTGAYRGAGRPEATMMIERVMDAAARQIGIDPVEIRRRNFIQPDQFPYSTPGESTYDSGNYPRLLAYALELGGFDDWRGERDDRRGRGELVGIGVCTFVELTGAGWESGRVRVEQDGMVTAIPGSTNHGQGHRTMFAQIVADELGVPYDQVRVLQNDTDLTPSAFGTFGSRSTVTGGGALTVASREVKERALQLAAESLEASVDDLDWRDGAAAVRGAPERARTLAQLALIASNRASAAPREDGLTPLESLVRFDAGGEVMAAGAYLAMVSIDPDTGRPRVERFVAVDDCGTVINPLIVEGQVHGGLAQGFGEALWERMVYDQDGHVLTGSLLDYAIPVAHGLLNWQTGRTTTPSPLHPLGAKGMGEAGTIGSPPALVNAVLDALSPYDVREISLPMTDEKIWRAMRADRLFTAEAQRTPSHS